jgi:hypothetical protein
MNEEWNKKWKDEIKILGRLAWIPNEQDQKRVLELQKELNDIVDRNTEKEENENE